jgi:hypothetical protein
VAQIELWDLQSRQKHQDHIMNARCSGPARYLQPENTGCACFTQPWHRSARGESSRAASIPSLALALASPFMQGQCSLAPKQPTAGACGCRGLGGEPHNANLPDSRNAKSMVPRDALG